MSPVKRSGKKKPVGSDGRSWFFQRLLDAWTKKYSVDNIGIVELKYGRIFAKTAAFGVRRALGGCGWGPSALLHWLDSHCS